MMRAHFCAILILVLATIHSAVIAEGTVWAENFNLPGFNGTVLAMAENAEARFYGGEFTQVGNVSANRVVRVDKATGVITSLGSAAQNGTNGTVRALAVSGDDLFVGGDFTTVSSSTQSEISANKIARWSLSGGHWTPLGSAAKNGIDDGWNNARVHALLVSGTDVFVGGYFNTVSSSTQNAIAATCIARWSTTGNFWSALGTPTQNGTGGQVFALALSGTDLFVGGSFFSVSSGSQNNISAGNIACWNTTGNSWSLFGTSTQNGVNSDVMTLAVNGSDLFVGGGFRTVSSDSQDRISARYIAKWNGVGGSWTPMGSEAQNGTDGRVNSIVMHGSDLFVGGWFTKVNDPVSADHPAEGIAKWNTTGNTWAPLNIAAQSIKGVSVSALAVSGNDLMVAGGTMRVRSNSPNANFTDRVAKWNLTTNLWERAFPDLRGDGIDGVVSAIVDGGSVIYVGGSFTLAGNVDANNVACWDKSTRTWSALGSREQNGVSGSVTSLAVIDGELFVGGFFSSVSSSGQNSMSANNIARWSATAGSWTPLGSASQNGTNSYILALAVLEGDLFVGGAFTSVSSSSQSAVSANRIARWSTAGSFWSALGSPTQNGTDQRVFSLAVSGTDLFVGGEFSGVRSSSQSFLSAALIARWSPVTSTWLPMGSVERNGTNTGVFALAIIGTDLYVGGNFNTVLSTNWDRISANRIARWSLTSGTWSPLGSATQNGLDPSGGAVNCMAASGTDLWVGGSFTNLNSSNPSIQSANRIVRWSSTGEFWSPLGSPTQNGVEADVFALAISGDDLFVGGTFVDVSSTTQRSVGSNNIATAFISVAPPGWNFAKVTSNPNAAYGSRTGAAHSSWYLYYYKGTDSNIWCTYWTGTQWMQAQLTSDANVDDWLAYGTSYGLLAYKGKDNRLWVAHWTGFAWTTAQLGTNPTTTVAGDVAIDNAWNIIYYRGADARVWAAHWTGAQWTHTSLGGTATVQDSLAVDDKYHLVYYRGSDSQLWCDSWNGAAWVQVQLTTTANVGGTVTADTAGGLAYYRASTDGSAWCTYWTGSVWAQVQLDAQAGIASTSSFSAYGPYILLYLNTNAQCAAEYWGGSSWGSTVLGDGGWGLTGGLSLHPATKLAFARRADGQVVVFYYQ
jgi:trimeric autotransporter adhesin